MAQNVGLADMSLQIPLHDARRIEVVCNGLPLWHGQQLAVDATIVSPVRRDGQPRSGADARPATALAQRPCASAARPILSSTAHAGAAWSCLGWKWVAGGQRKQAHLRVCWREPEHGQRLQRSSKPYAQHWCTDGVASSPWPCSAPSLRHCWSSDSTTGAVMAQCHLGLSSLQTHVGRSRLLLAACRRHAGECACGMHRDPRPPRAEKGRRKKKEGMFALGWGGGSSLAGTPSPARRNDEEKTNDADNTKKSEPATA